MKKIKVSLIYIVIVFLCVFAIVDRFAQSRKSDSTSDIGIENVNVITSNSEDFKESSEDITKYSKPVVGIGLGSDYEATTMAAVENAGGLKDLIKKGQVVLIKPNICTISTPGSSVITDYRTVQKIADMAIEYGAEKVIVAEGTICGNAFVDIALKVNKYGSLKRVELLNLNSIEKKDCYELKASPSNTGKALFIPKIYMDADVVISIAKLKTHAESVVTLSLKNAFGVPSEKVYGGSGYKSGLHSLGLDAAITDLNLIRKPDLAIIEGITGGEGYGPIDNTLVKSNIILAGRDLVALDTVALTFMGFKVEQVPHVKLAAKNNMGVSDLNKINIIGADINTIKMDFKSEFKK